MKSYYMVAFKYSEDIFCFNIAHADSIEDVKTYYSKYSWVYINDCPAYELESAKCKGIPIIEI